MKKSKSQKKLESYDEAHGITRLSDIVGLLSPGLTVSYQAFMRRWTCVAPNCEHGKVFGETCRACKGLGYILPKDRV